MAGRPACSILKDNAEIRGAWNTGPVDLIVIIIIEVI